jgi:hypothetical protein
MPNTSGTFSLSHWNLYALKYVLMGRPVMGLKWSLPSSNSTSQRRQILLRQHTVHDAHTVAMAGRASALLGVGLVHMRVLCSNACRLGTWHAHASTRLAAYVGNFIEARGHVKWWWTGLKWSLLSSSSICKRLQILLRQHTCKQTKCQRSADRCMLLNLPAATDLAAA